MQRKRRRISIGLSVILVSMASFLCIFTFNTINRVFFDATADLALETMEVVCDLGVNLVESKLLELKSNLEQTASEYENQLDGEITEADLTGLPLPEDGIEYWLAYTDGKAVDSEGGVRDWKKEAGLEKVFDSGKTTVFDPYFDEDGAYIFSIATPVFKEGKLCSVLMIRLDGYCISRWIERIQYPISQGIGYIIAGDGRNIADSKEENYDWITSMYNAQELRDNDSESKTVADLELQPLEGKTGRGTYVWEGSTNYIVYAPIRETGWGFFSGFYGDPVKEYIRQSAAKSTLSSVPFVLLIFLFFAFVLLYANYNLKKERGYIEELILQKQEIEAQAENLRVNEERFRVALAQTSNTIFEYDLVSGNIINFYSSKNTNSNLDLENGLENYIITKGTIEQASLKRLRNIFSDIKNGIFDNECIIKVYEEDNTIVWYKISISPLSEQRTHVIGIVEDITKEKQADLDAMTGLLNKKVIAEQVTEYLQNRTPSELYALLMIDIDDFKLVNDKYGHPAGDRVIMQTGSLLNETFSKNSYVGRVGGDEFCIFCFKLASQQALEETVKAFYCLAQQAEGIPVTYSCGIALGKGRTTFEKIYKQADNALYQSKLQGKNRYCYDDGRKD